MAIFTISSDTNYSAIKGSLANGDTIRIDTNTVRLTIDEEPLLTSITVDSPGVSGRMTVSGAYDMSTWSIFAGTGTLIDGTFPAGATLGSVTGGAASGSVGISQNAGTVILSTGGTTSNCQGVGTNQPSGVVLTAIAGTGTSAVGVSANNGLVDVAISSSASSGFGVNNNNGTVNTATANGNVAVLNNNGTVGVATGGSGNGHHGVGTNNGTVLEAIGGTNAGAHGVNTNLATVFAASNNTGFGVNNSFTAIKVVDGPNYASRIITSGTARPVTTVYSIGPLSSSASVSAGITVIEVSADTAAAILATLRGGFQN